MYYVSCWTEMYTQIHVFFTMTRHQSHEEDVSNKRNSWEKKKQTIGFSSLR